MAEFVMKDMVRKAELAGNFEIASAATSREEIGNPVYPPAREHFLDILLPVHPPPKGLVHRLHCARPRRERASHLRASGHFCAR